MKNLLIYVNPNGCFDAESGNLVKIQIENSLGLGWKKDDILLITNFPYQYQEIKSIEVKGGYCPWQKEGSKITTIVHLFDIGFIGNELYWCHDLDAYQLEPISEEELGLEGFDAGFNDYGRKPQWQLGSIFFKNKAEDIFREIASRMSPKLDSTRHLLYDEYVMLTMTNENFNNINNRIKRLNITYDFGMRKIELCYEKANKPLKVLHFHPHNPKLNTLAIAMYGRNRIHKPLMNERLIKIFKKYGYQ